MGTKYVGPLLYECLPERYQWRIEPISGQLMGRSQSVDCDIHRLKFYGRSSIHPSREDVGHLGSSRGLRCTSWSLYTWSYTICIRHWPLDFLRRECLLYSRVQWYDLQRRCHHGRCLHFEKSSICLCFHIESLHDICFHSSIGCEFTLRSCWMALGIRYLLHSAAVCGSSTFHYLEKESRQSQEAGYSQ